MANGEFVGIVLWQRGWGICPRKKKKETPQNERGGGTQRGGIKTGRSDEALTGSPAEGG